MVDASLDGKKGENVILKQPSYRFESCPDYNLVLVEFQNEPINGEQKEKQSTSLV